MKVLGGKFSIKQTVVLVAAAGLLIAVFSILISLNTNHRVDHLIGHIKEHAQTTRVKQDLFNELEANLGYGGVIHNFKNYILRSDEKYIAHFREKVRAVLADIDAYRKQNLTEEEAADLAALEAVVRTYLRQAEMAQHLIMAGKTPAEIDTAVEVDDQPALAAITGLREKLEAEDARYQQELSSHLHEVKKMALLNEMVSPAALLLLTGLVVIALFRIRRVIGGEPQAVEQVTRRVAEGNLDIATEFHDQTTSGILDATLRSVASISSVVHQTGDIAKTVDTSVDHIKGQVDELTERFASQRSNIRHTADRMTQMTEITHQNAASAELANKLTTEATQSALQGSEVVKQVVDAMGQINAASERIANIITVIDEIAFQTNLLALNAAVEAARAGDHGKGFAVVATEVRNLAQRSATAAKEIEGLIADSRSKVNDGTGLVNAAGSALEKIFESVEKVDGVVTEMAASNKQQAVGIDEVAILIGQVESVRTANETQVQAIAADCELLDRQANELMQTIGFFRTGRREASDFQLTSSTDFDTRTDASIEAWALSEPFADVQALSHDSDSRQVAEVGNGWHGEERRSATRPWGDRQTAGSNSLRSDDQDWDAF